MKNKVHSRKLAVAVEWIHRVYMTAFFGAIAAVIMWTLTLFSAWLLAPSTVQAYNCLTPDGHFENLPASANNLNEFFRLCQPYTVPGPKIYEVSASLPAFLLATGMVVVMGLIAYAIYTRPQTEQKSAQKARREEREAGKEKDEVVEAVKPSKTESGVRFQGFSEGSFSNAEIHGRSE